ncbi:unnamed protein product [Calicophoron daubneyi]|uniref:Uncharacterized protein n=1 Tax=Calicophoron daubneyi TaxID=300641 RepID=A0AAV2TA16_CALDB
MADRQHRLESAASKWTNSELDQIIEALKRDRSFTRKELSEYVRTKSCTQVGELFSVLLSVSEEELLGVAEEGEKAFNKPEGSIDILIQSTRNISPEPFNFSLAASDVLEEYIKQIEEKKKVLSGSAVPGSSIGLRYPDIYSFLACLMRNRPLPVLNEVGAGAVLDLLTCLVRLLKLIQDDTEDDSQTRITTLGKVDRSQLKLAWKNACEKITHLIGIYLAAAAASRHATSLGGINEPWDPKQLRQHPIAPFFVLSGVRLPDSLKAARALKRTLINDLASAWNFPKLQDVSLDAGWSSEDTATHLQLVRALSMFNLNPFSLPRSVVRPFQALVDEVSQSNVSLSFCIERLSPLLFPTVDPLPLDEETVILPNPVLYKMKRSGGRKVSAKRRKEKMKRGTGTTCLPSKRPRRRGEKRIESIMRNKQWKASDFFKRVGSTRDAKRTKLMVEQHIVIKETRKTGGEEVNKTE